MLKKKKKNCSYDSRIVNHREIIGRLTSHKDSGASAQLSWQCRARKKAEDWKKKSEIMHICKYHLKDDKCYLKNICKVKHPKLQRYYQRISMHKLFCDQSGKIFLNDYGWMIWLSHDMTNSADLNGYHITSPTFGICLYHSPSSFGRRRPRTYLLSNYKRNCMFVSTGPSGLLKTTSGTMCSRFTPTHTLQQVQHRDRLQSSETRLGKSSQLSA